MTKTSGCVWDPKLSLVFCNTKHMVDELANELQNRGYFAEGLHGDMKQQQRDRVMRNFRNGKTEILVATDVAARGSQSELRLPLLQVVSSNKYFSVGVQSPTEINAPRGRTLSGRQWFCADRNGV